MSLVDSLFDLSRITGGQLRLQREPLDVVDIARDVADRLVEVAAMAGVTLEFHAEGTAVGVWDRLRVEQIIENLASNAIKYAPNAPVELSVGTETTRPRSPCAITARVLRPPTWNGSSGPFSARCRRGTTVGSGWGSTSRQYADHGGIHFGHIDPRAGRDVRGQCRSARLQCGARRNLGKRFVNQLHGECVVNAR
jgi:hypothetical protein